MYKILIVEDDPVISSLIAKHLKTWNFEVKEISDFSNVMESYHQFVPHLVLLDITLPFYNGYHWCNEIRQISQVPIMFISSASDQMNIVMAMNMGADDFIAKPFDFPVLIAKLQALLRRSYDFSKDTSSLTCGEVTLNLEDASMTCASGKIELTKNDYRILRILMENRGKIVTRNEMMQSLWQTDEFIDDNTLTVNITRLRKKLEEAGIEHFIKTKKGIGYMVE